MEDITETRPVFISCQPGLGEYLARELARWDYTVEAVHHTGVELYANFREAMRLNVILRTAYSVLYLLQEFTCNGPQQLYRQVTALPWEDWIDPAEYISVDSWVDHPSINNSMFPNMKVKDAVVDRIKRKAGRRPNSGPDKTGVVLYLHWKGKRCRLYLNTSGVKLSDRNYRKMPFKAPMRETLAAAVLQAAGYEGTCPLVNPMGGSGTLAIEAALLAAGRMPGLLRSNYGFMHVKFFDAAAWQVLRNEFRKNKSKHPPPPIVMTDIDRRAVEAARRNARTAGVEHLIEFDVCDFAETHLPEEPGIIMLNPEYGLRLGEGSALEATYKRIGDFFKQRCSGWTGYIFTGNLDLAKKVGLRTSRRMIFYNADIECRLLKYELYAGTKKTTTQRAEHFPQQ